MYLYGASGHAKVIMDILHARGIHPDGLVDDNPDIAEILGVPVIHEPLANEEYIISIGNNSIRKRLAHNLPGSFSPALTHPTSIISRTATIEEGSVVMQGSIIQTCTTIGKHCIINTGASLDHECKVGNYVHISPHATLCGNVQVGEGTWIGAGSTVIQGIRIGKWSIIGAGSVVTKDIPDGVLAYGNPCKVIRNISQ